MKSLLLILVAFSGGSLLYASWLRRRLDAAMRILEDERMRQRSISASYGRITEQWFPLMRRYPYDSSNFRFLGSPIDGVQFEEDRVVFVEFKSRRSELSAQQKRIKRLIETGRVSWEEFHFTEE